MRSTGSLDLASFGLGALAPKDFRSFLSGHTLLAKAKREGLNIDLTMQNARIHIHDWSTHSYEAALIADLLRYKLMAMGKKFTFETVMSHESKVDFLKKSQQEGYKNYLYFVATESPLINVERVRQRVRGGGHAVEPSKIESRYHRSLHLLRDAVQYTYRTFVFDNSGDQANLILEVYQGSEVLYKYSEIPRWVDHYLLE